MGLDATVGCNCIRDGLEIPLSFKDKIILDEEGYYELELPYEGNENLCHKFDKWKATACQHEDMDLVFERVANWYGVQTFLQALRDDGINRFRTLIEEIPDANGGITKTENAVKMLEELREFKAIDKMGNKYVLVDVSSEDELWEYVPAYARRMIYSGDEEINLGLDEKGFFIEGNQGEVLFRSSHFRQILHDLKKTENHLNGRVTFIDLHSNEAYDCYSAISGKQILWKNGKRENRKGQVRFQYPEEFSTKLRERNTGGFDYIINPLEKLCEASIVTLNPIRWC